MQEESIGRIIAGLRKEKGCTQEELAKAVGISTQAVSKWECGGMPDLELLPAIADYFHISIDTLFHRNVEDYSELRTAVNQQIAAYEQAARFPAAMEYCWALQKGLMGQTQDSGSWEEVVHIAGDHRSYSQILFPEGISLFSLRAALPYFLLMPEPEQGWKKGLDDKEAYHRLFQLLGDQETLDCLFFLHERVSENPFTSKLLEKHLNLSGEKVMQILESLKSYAFITEAEIELDDVKQKIYTFRPNPAFVALLAVAQELIHRPVNFNYYCGHRQKTYL